MPLPQRSDFAARPLPPNPFHLTAPVVHAAYNICLSLELRAPLVLPSEKHPSSARVLGFALIEFPAREHIAQAINTHRSDHTLLALGKYYIQRLSRLFKAPTSVPSLDDVEAASPSRLPRHPAVLTDQIPRLLSVTATIVYSIQTFMMRPMSSRIMLPLLRGTRVANYQLFSMRISYRKEMTSNPRLNGQPPHGHQCIGLEFMDWRACSRCLRPFAGFSIA